MLYYQSLSFFLKTIIRTATITAAARTPTAIYILPSPVADVSVVTADGTAVVVMVVVVVVVFAVPSIPVFPPLLEDAWEDDELEEEELCDEELDDEFEDEPPVAAPKPERKPALSREPARKTSNVTPMRASKSLLPNMEVCVVKPTQLDDSREIINTLLAGRTVILNLEGLDLEIAQRIIDFTSGAAFAIDGKLQKISSYIFLVTPPNVEISGDLQDLLGGGSLTTSPVSRF